MKRRRLLKPRPRPQKGKRLWQQLWRHPDGEKKPGYSTPMWHRWIQPEVRGDG